MKYKIYHIQKYILIEKIFGTSCNIIDEKRIDDIQRMYRSTFLINDLDQVFHYIVYVYYYNTSCKSYVNI